MRDAVVIQHVAFEDLGSLEPVLRERGFHLRTVEASTAEYPLSIECDLLIVLGGPIGVYEQADYPFLDGEVTLLRQRLLHQLPTLGICLGSQLMAAALGARVYPGKQGAEIGWYPLRAVGTPPKWFEPLLAEELPVLHWHGDTFEIPAGAEHLAASSLYPAQAFSVGNYALALQFHPEVTAHGLERWYVGHTAELHQKKIPVAGLRAEAARYAAALERASRLFWSGWLDQAFSGQ